MVLNPPDNECIRRGLLEPEWHQELTRGEREGAARHGRELSVQFEGENGAVRVVVHLNCGKVLADDLVRLDLDCDGAAVSVMIQRVSGGTFVESMRGLIASPVVMDGKYLLSDGGKEIVNPGIGTRR